MKLICAGFPKTGTKTIRQALNELGFEVYDFIEHFWYHSKEWDLIFEDKMTIDGYKEMYKDVDAVIDLPACFYWEQIQNAFPEAKILLSYRENEDINDWWNSMLNQLRKIHENRIFTLILKTSPTGFKFLKFFDKIGKNVFGHQPRGVFQPVDYHEVSMKQSYLKHYARVKQGAPSDSILTYKCSQGWEPLCKLLNVKVPDKPFPHENIRGNVIDEAVKNHPFIRKMKIELALIGLILLFLVSFIIIMGLYQFY